jgi:hypothetical protein
VRQHWVHEMRRFQAPKARHMPLLAKSPDPNNEVPFLPDGR